MTALVGTGRLIRLVLRRDRAVLPLWVIWLGIIGPIAASAFRGLYPTDAALAVAGRGFAANPAFRTMFGPVFSLDLGGLTAWRLSIVMVVAAVVSALVVIRHTRVEEESGRRELVGSTVVGRHAPLVAALVVVMGADLVLGTITTAALIGQGLDPAGSIALGAELAVTGILFAAVGAMAAQLTESSGAARGIALGTIALAYAVRAAGDAASPVAWLAWVSPLGWVQRVQAFAPEGERWWLLAATVLLVVAVILATAAVASRRDVGGGLLRPRPGPATAAPRLRTAFALAWRLHRGLVAGWSVAFVVLGTLYGSVAPSVADMLRDSPDMMEIFARLGGTTEVIVDRFLAAVGGIFGLIASGYAVQASLRMRVEEESLRLDPVLATATSRASWVTAQIAMALLGPVVALTAAGTAAGVAFGIASGDVGGQVPRLVATALVQVPAVWLLASVAIVLFGRAPRQATAAWGVYGGVVFITFFGALLRFGQWFLDLSPFTHVPALPAAGIEIPPLAGLTGLALLLVAAGFTGFRRRDLG